MSKRGQKLRQINYLNAIADLVKNRCIDGDKLNELFYASLFDASSLESEETFYFTARELENYVKKIVENCLFSGFRRENGKCWKLWNDRFAKYKHGRNIYEFLNKIVYSDVLTRGILIGILEREGIGVQRKLSTGDMFRDIVIGRRENDFIFTEVKRYLSGKNISENLSELADYLLYKQPEGLRGKRLLVLVLIPEEPSTKHLLERFLRRWCEYRRFQLKRLEGMGSGAYLLEYIGKKHPALKDYNIRVLVHVVSESKGCLQERYTLMGLVSRIKTLVNG